MSKFLSWLGQNAMGLLGLGSGFATQAMNQHNQNVQNEFNASEAAKNRNFQAQQAQIARDYQTEFYETYQSPSAMVRQYKDAGMNPALMAGGYNPPSAVSTSSPSGSAASAASPNYQSMEGMINAIASLAQLKANIDNTKADTDFKRASAFNQERQGLAQNAAAALSYQNIKVSKAELSKIEQNVEFLKESSLTQRQQRYLNVVDATFKKAAQQQIDFKNTLSSEFEKQFGFKADADTINSLLLTAGNVMSAGIGSIGGVLSFFKGKGLKKQKSLDIPFSEITGNVN